MKVTAFIASPTSSKWKLALAAIKVSLHMAILAWSAASAAQTSLFTYSRTGEVGSSKAAASALSELKARKNTEANYIIINGDALQKAEISFSLPDGKSLVFHRSKNNVASNSITYWYGTTKTGEEASFALDGFSMSGSFIYEGKVYAIVPLPEGRHALEIRRTRPRAPTKPPVTTAPQSSLRILRPTAATAALTPGVDILVLHDSALLRQVVAERYIADLNQSFSNSGLSNIPDASARMVGFVRVSFLPTGNLDADVLKLKSRAEYTQLRDKYGADVVILLRRLNAEEGECGVVPSIGPTDSDAYAIVEEDCAVEVRAFAHEFGHIAGVRHQTDTTPGYSHAFIGRFPNRANPNCTLSIGSDMTDPNFADCGDASQVVNFWSSANLVLTSSFWGNITLGNYAYSDSVRWLRGALPIVASFRGSMGGSGASEDASRAKAAVQAITSVLLN